MKRGLQFLKWLPAMLPPAAVFFLWSAGNQQPLTGLRITEINDNPNEFYLCATNAAYDYHFTYDPLAADEWLFHTGGPVHTNSGLK